MSDCARCAGYDHDQQRRINDAGRAHRAALAAMRRAERQDGGPLPSFELFLSGLPDPSADAAHWTPPPVVPVSHPMRDQRPE